VPADAPTPLSEAAHAALAAAYGEAFRLVQTADDAWAQQHKWSERALRERRRVGEILIDIRTQVAALDGEAAGMHAGRELEMRLELSHSAAQRWRKLASIPQARFDGWIKKRLKNADELSQAALLRDLTPPTHKLAPKPAWARDIDNPADTKKPKKAYTGSKVYAEVRRAEEQRAEKRMPKRELEQRVKAEERAEQRALRELAMLKPEAEVWNLLEDLKIHPTAIEARIERIKEEAGGDQNDYRRLLRGAALILGQREGRDKEHDAGAAEQAFWRACWDAHLSPEQAAVFLDEAAYGAQGTWSGREWCRPMFGEMHPGFWEEFAVRLNEQARRVREGSTPTAAATLLPEP
jgi:hypothetical protein